MLHDLQPRNSHRSRFEPVHIPAPFPDQSLTLIFHKHGIHVKRSHQRVGRAGAFNKLQLVLEGILVDSVTADVDHRRLSKTGKRLMSTVNYNIRSQVFSRHRLSVRRVSFEKLQVCTMCLIHDQNLSRLMNHLGNSLYVAADSIIIRTRQYARAAVRIFLNQTPDFLSSNSPRNSVPLHNLRVGVYRSSSRHGNGVVNRLVAVSGHYQLPALRHSRHNSRNQTRAASVN